MYKILCIFILLSIYRNDLYSQVSNDYAPIRPSETNNGRIILPGYYLSSIPVHEYQSVSGDINYPLLGGISAVYLGTGIAVHFYQQNAWWKDQRVKFHTINDFRYSLWVDKAGHMYASSLLSHFFSSGLEAANFDLERSAIYGSALAFAFELYVEIEDGYAKDWGFSWGDITADLLGSGLNLAQYYVPELKNFQLRFSYWPVQAGKTDPNTNQQNIIIDDYEGQKYWLSMRIKNLLPDGISDFWPAFLNISFGMGAKNIHHYDKDYREFYIALDLDAEEIPLYGKGWQFVKNTLNFIHFPMPGLRISPNSAFFVFCF